MFCKNCGNELDHDSKFCIYCGTAITIKAGSKGRVVIPDSTKLNQPIETKRLNRLTKSLFIIFRFVILPVLVMSALYFILYVLLDGKTVGGEALQKGIVAFVSIVYIFLFIELVRGIIITINFFSTSKMKSKSKELRTKGQLFVAKMANAKNSTVIIFFVIIVIILLIIKIFFQDV